MKLYYFSEMPHHEYPDEEGANYPSLRLGARWGVCRREHHQCDCGYAASRADLSSHGYRPGFYIRKGPLLICPERRDSILHRARGGGLSRDARVGRGFELAGEHNIANRNPLPRRRCKEVLCLQ